eukprot:g60885.t1
MCTSPLDISRHHAHLYISRHVYLTIGYISPRCIPHHWISRHVYFTNHATIKISPLDISRHHINLTTGYITLPRNPTTGYIMSPCIPHHWIYLAMYTSPITPPCIPHHWIYFATMYTSPLDIFRHYVNLTTGYITPPCILHHDARVSG